MLTLQEIVLKLTHFWEKQGCVIHFGHDLETGAGTFNPATFLRCLGPEPYSTAYVEPSRRPADARFGQNPNRIQLFHQYQVILKPSPKDVQKLYLRSLAAIGLKLEKHDIRFVHDDWESPTLGAWGLGWEVWCDGMEISQFTYFQGMASLPLKPISAEITYGLERLCMFIQNVDHILNIQWNESLTLGDISKQNEVEWATYNFSVSDPQMWLRHFDDYEKEAKRLVSQELPLPAYDFVVKASHAFNMLEARGVISVTERTRYIGRIRDLARLIATSYIEQREKKGFPLLKKTIQKPHRLLKIPSKFNPHTKRDFLLEIGSEELPATFVPIGMRHLKQSILTLLEKHHLSFEAVSVYGTPRRLAIIVHKLAEGTAPKIVEKRGPSLAIAFDAEENWTPQGDAFLRSLNIPKSSLESIRAGRSKSLEIRQIKDTAYLFALVREEGQSTAHLLSSSLPSLIENLEFPKKMRWADLDVTYARPVHWIVSLFGSTVIPFAFGDVVADRTTWGHAQLDCVKIAIKHPSDYLPSLRDHYVIADVEERKKSILAQIEKLRPSYGDPLKQEKVLSEVLFLAEYPQLAAASFDASFLRAPSEIVISEMVEHQKYFPVADEKGHLKNLCFITADNTPNELIISGNQKVLSARLADGVFLYEQDAKIPLEELTTNLKNVTFQKDLGSVFDKVERICKLASLWHTFLKKGDPKIIQRIAFLCKADLSSSCVKEFPELQGVIGRYFAVVQKEDLEVAEGIEEHWMPKGEGMPLPQTPGGTLVSLADKTDNLLGYYSVGLKPTSSSDPYGLRRQAIGILRMLIEGKISIDLFSLFQEASSLFQNPPLEEIFLFITARAKSLFEDKGLAKDEIEATLSPMCINPYDQLCKAQALQSFRRTPDFAKLFEVYKRVRGQLTNPVTSSFRLELTTTAHEKSLASALSHLSSAWNQALLTKDYTQACSLLASLKDPLASLFEHVKIMADEIPLRENRLALLKTVFDLFHSLADFSKLQTDA